MAAEVTQAPGAGSRTRLVVAMALYGILLVASLATLSDWRIRLVTVAIVLLFAGRTLWQPRRTEAPSPWGRGADLGEALDEGDAEQAAADEEEQPARPM